MKDAKVFNTIMNIGTLFKVSANDEDRYFEVDKILSFQSFKDNRTIQINTRQYNYHVTIDIESFLKLYNNAKYNNSNNYSLYESVIPTMFTPNYNHKAEITC